MSALFFSSETDSISLTLAQPVVLLIISSPQIQKEYFKTLSR